MMGTVTEPERLALHQWAGEQMNELTAEGFMKSLPPMGWDDLATKSDLAALETKMDSKFEALETKIDTLGTVLAATFSAQLATEIGGVRKEALRQFVALLVALIALTATSLVGETVLPHYFPPAPPQIIIQSPSE